MTNLGKGISRRVLLGQLACAASWAQSDDDPMRQLRAGHPRLILGDAEIERIRGLVRDHPQGRRLYVDLEKESDRLLNIPPAEYKLTGPRLSAQCRKVLDRVSTLALMYRVTLREPYLRRAVTELRTAANWHDWNPAVSTDTAEMTHAFSIGYDWLYNALSPEERGLVRDAIVSKGLDQALMVYQHEGGWPQDRYNRNIVCNSGMGIGALAVANDAEGEAGRDINEKCSSVLRYALESIPHGLATYGIEGSWPEGPDYWHYVTEYACVFFNALQTALGNDYGLSAFHGVDRSGRYRIYTTHQGRSFNFGDSVEDSGLAPELFWLAKRFNLPVYTWAEQRGLERNIRPEAYDLIWFERDSKPPQQAPALPLDAVFRSVNVACFRSAWGDSDAVFLAVKGGDNKTPHAHLDLGSFVLSAGGVRWAADLGPDDFDLPGYFNSSRRWSYYRLRTEAHNTLLIDNENQDPRAEAHITRQEFSPDLSWVQIDLSKVNAAKVKQWIRRIGLAQRQAVLVTDSVRSDQPVEVIWGMITDAEIGVSGQTATLHKGGWNLAAEIRAPRHAVFDTAPVRSTPPQASNANYRKLIVRLGDKVTDLDLNIVLTPYRDGQPKPKIATQFPV